MVELADAAPKAFSGVAAPVLSGCLDVAATPGFGGGARSLAVELACSLCERAPATARRCAAGGAKWPAKAVDACFEMLAEDEPRDDPAAWEHAPGPPPELDAASGRELGADPARTSGRSSSSRRTPSSSPRSARASAATGATARAAACRCALLFLDAAPYGAVGPHLPLLAETLAAAVAPASPPHVREHAVAAVAALAEAASYQSDGSTKAAEGQQVLAGVAGDDDDSDADENDEFVVRTEALEAQANGCQSVLLLADALGGHFAGAVEKCFLTLAPLVSHAIADDVRSYAAAALPALVDCARLGDGANAAAALLFALEALLAAVAEEEDLEPLLTALQATKATIEAGCRDDGEAGTEAPRPATAARCRPLLLGTRLAPDKVLDALHGCLAASLQRRAVRRAEATMDEDYDDDAREAHEEAAALDGMVVYNVAEALGAVLRTHGASAFDALKGAWLPRLADMADERCVEHDRGSRRSCSATSSSSALWRRRASTTRRARGSWARRRRSCPRCCASRRGSPAAAGGDLACAAASSLGPSGHFSPHAPAALASIAAAMALRPSDAALAAGGASDDDDDGDDDGRTLAADEMVADNAAAALLKVLRAAPGGGGGQARAWVSYLPLRADPEEAASCLGALCADLVQPGLLGAVPLADKVACVARCAAALRENAEGTTARAAHRPEDLMAAWQTLPHDAQAVVSALAALQ
ncbi:hypothetical protein JL720_3716 [Aureococcus anophagefferens]|nr:hypothetical protein JL720_3716 [Aureococcus anophagefferens]